MGCWALIAAHGMQTFLDAKRPITTGMVNVIRNLRCIAFAVIALLYSHWMKQNTHSSGFSGVRFAELAFLVFMARPSMSEGAAGLNERCQRTQRSWRSGI